MSLPARLTASGLAALLLAGSLAAAAPVTAAPAAAPAGTTSAASAQAAEPTAGAAAVTIAKGHATTSARERKRVDSVRTPKLNWYKCYGWAQCATARVPLDYDDPRGRTTQLALLRVKATNQKAKIGSLFVNPGGPGASATDLALVSPLFLSDSLLERFDIVGVDPRGVGASTNVTCFTSVAAQTRTLGALTSPFPYGKKEEAKYVTALKALGKACSTTGRTVAGAMSTAEVARDMDVMRRAVGDRKLTYLGFSYGSALGQYYANMFPERFRAIAVDGVIDPTSWVGDSRTSGVIQDDRLRSADGAYRALREILKRCDAAGEEFCEFAEGDPVARFEIIAQRLKATPFVLPALLPGLGDFSITYADFVGQILGALYSPAAGEIVAAVAQSMWILTDPEFADDPTALATARTTLARHLRTGRDFMYLNDAEAFSGVMCTDALHPKDASGWAAASAKSDKRAPYFGRLWAWGSAQCARNTWTVRDEDAYRGPFNRKTAATVLVVGSLWDPATNYVEAVSSAKLLPNSRMLTSDNFGHTAYGTGDCATGVMDKYLLRGTLPAKGAVCKAVDQPFTTPLLTDEDKDLEEIELSGASKSEVAAMGLPAAGADKQLPPVAGR
jgi:pimeloyl-ACP methyl ester carboxylesterase